MKKLISTLLILAVLLCSAPALANTLNTDKGLTAEFSVNVNSSAVMQLIGSAAGMEDTVGNVLSILNNLKIKLAMKGQAGQLDMSLKNKQLIALGFGAENGGYTLVCDLLPEYAFHLSAETLQKINQELSKSIPTDINVNEAAKALLRPLDNLLNAVSQKVGAPESGSYTVDGMEFNARIPVDLTKKEAELLLLQYAKEVVADPAAEPLLIPLSAFFVTNTPSEDVDLKEAFNEALDSIIASTEQYGDETSLDIVIYGDVSEYGVASKTYAEIKFDSYNTAYVGQIDNCFVLKVVENDGGHLLSISVDDTEKGALATFQYKEYGTDVLLKCDITDRGDGGFESRTDVYFNGSDSLGTVFFNVSSGANISLPANSSGKAVIDFEELGSGSSQELQSLLMNALPTLLNKAQDAMPDEMGSLMQMLNLGDVSGY